MTIFLTFILALMPYTLYSKECIASKPLMTFKPKYAQHFSIETYKNFKLVFVDKKKYFLANDLESNCFVNDVAAFIRTPVHKVAMMSTTYLPALNLLELEKTLVAFQGVHSIVSDHFNLNELKDIPFKYNPEELLAIKTDLIMGHTSNFLSQDLTNTESLFKKLKLPVVINKDFEEKSPLARAEWIVFIASFYNREVDAQKIFNNIEKNYNDLKLKAQLYSNIPTVLVGDIQNGAWITCGAESDLAQMIQDAGGMLLLKKKSSKTQNLSLEELSLIKEPIQIWLTQNTWRTNSEKMKAMTLDKRYSLIKPIMTFNNNKILNKNGSNDYWETAMQRPDLLLQDLVELFHHSNSNLIKLKWYQPL